MPTLINLSFLYWWVEDYFAKIVGVAWECVWIVEKPHQKHLSPPLCLVPAHWSSKSRLPLQNFLNPGYPPRFQRSQTVLGNSWDFRRQGFWATSSLQVWNVSSQLQGVATGLNGLLGMWNTQTNLSPSRARTHFSCTGDHKAQMLVQRGDVDICKIDLVKARILNAHLPDLDEQAWHGGISTFTFVFSSYFFVSLWQGASINARARDFFLGETGAEWVVLNDIKTNICEGE